MAVEKDPDWFLGFSFASFRVFPWSMATSARVMMWPLCCLSISPLDSPRHNLPPLPNSTSGLRAALGSATPGKLQTITTLVFFLGIFLLLLIYWFNSISTMDASIHFNVISGIFKTWKTRPISKSQTADTTSQKSLHWSHNGSGSSKPTDGFLTQTCVEGSLVSRHGMTGWLCK